MEAELAISEQDQESVAAWRERNHIGRHPDWLMGSIPKQVWNDLLVLDHLRPGATMLNIGVGLGYEARDLVARGCTVHCLDIAQVALDQVAEIATCWRADKIDTLPENLFDLAYSHLVAQHMADDDLALQLCSVIRAFKPQGLLAMQFVYVTENPEERNPVISHYQKGGGVLHSPARMSSMVEAANGRVLLSRPFRVHSVVTHHVIHALGRSNGRGRA